MKYLFVTIIFMAGCATKPNSKAGCAGVNKGPKMFEACRK